MLVAATRRPYRYEAGKHESQPETPSSPSGSAPHHELASSPRSSGDSAASSARGLDLSPDSHPRSSAPSASSNSIAPRGHELPQAKLSPALESLLATAERRVLSGRNSSVPPSDRLSPEAELEAILPADVLDALDEPLDYDDDDDDADSAVSTNNGSDVDHGTRTGTKTTGAGLRGRSHWRRDRRRAAEPQRGARDRRAPPVTRPLRTPLNRSLRARTEPPVTPPQNAGRALAKRDAATSRASMSESAPAPSRPMNTFGGATAHGPISDLPPSVRSLSEPPGGVSTTPPRPRQAVDESAPGASAEPLRREARPEPQLEIPASLGIGDAVRAFARVVRARYTGALAFEDASGIRRVLFRDGDFVTAASGAEGESLVEFLTQRGDLSDEAAARIGRKLPQFGRHAGAALIAQGHLRQDDLWPVLRAHAEWLVARLVSLTRGAVGLESDAPARLQAEPAVFGGATGAEVLVEIVRRAVPPKRPCNASVAPPRCCRRAAIRRC